MYVATRAKKQKNKTEEEKIFKWIYQRLPVGKNETTPKSFIVESNVKNSKKYVHEHPSNSHVYTTHYKKFLL